MNVLDFETFQKFWLRVDDEPMDLRGCTFEDNPTIKGKKTIKNQKGYGLLRVVNEDGIIIFRTKKDDMAHGLTINVLENKIGVYINRNGVEIF